VLRDYLTMTRNLDPTALEQSHGDARDGLRPTDHRSAAWTCLCCPPGSGPRAAHRNTGRYSDDPVADRIMARISADENLHAAFYRDVLSAAMQVEPSATVEAVVAEIMAFEMPGAGLKGSGARPPRWHWPASTICASITMRW
jgi:acyl-[acyl-carrier-protein] desaturase